MGDELHAAERIAAAHHEDPYLKLVNRVLDMHERTLSMMERVLSPEVPPPPTDEDVPGDEDYEDPLKLEHPAWWHEDFDPEVPTHEPVAGLRPGERIHPDLPRPDETST